MHFVSLTLQTCTGSFVQWRVMLFAGFFRFWNGTGYMFFSFPFLSVFWARLAQVPSSSDASCSHYASVGILFFVFETESVSCSFSFSFFYFFCVRLATRSLNDHFFLIFLSSYMLVFEAFRRDGHVDVSQGSRCSAVAGMVTGRADLGADRAAELQRDPHRSQGARLKRATGIALQRSSHGHRASESGASNIGSSNERAFDVHL